MSKINKELALEDMLGMLDADRTVAPKSQEANTVNNQEESIPLDSPSIDKSVISKPLQKWKPTTITTTNVESKNESKTDKKNNPNKVKIVTTSSKKVLPTSNEFIFTLIENFTISYTKGEAFTSVRVLKEKVKYIKLLFPGQSLIKIIDILITEHLITNRSKLKKRKNSFYDVKF